MGVGFGARPDERFLGFGERSNAVDQRGNDVEVFVGEGPFQPEERPAIAAFVPPQGFHARDDATYYPVPWLLSTAGYGVLLDSPETSTFDLARSRPDVWSADVAAPRLAFRVFAGPRPADALARFTARTGRQPRVAAPWIFGAWWQPTPGGGEPDAQLAAQRRADVPVSVTETFLHYLPCADHLADRERERRRAAALHAGGTAALAYMNPMVCTDHPAYGEAEANGWFTKDASGPAVPRTATRPPTSSWSAQVDFTSPGGPRFFRAACCARRSTTASTAGWRTSASTRPRTARSADGTPGPAMHNLYPTLYHRTRHEETATAGRPDRQLRAIGLTGHRPRTRGIVWGGDPTTDWGFDGWRARCATG
jgi:alpha-glucosidase (family GH31 glycosyl hydrolase)